MMSIYNLVLFVHIIGAIGYLLSIGILLFILLVLRRARHIEQVRALIHLNNLSGPFGAGSALILLITGLYLALAVWSLLTGWILVALISLVLIVPTVAAFIAPRRRAIVDQLAHSAPDGQVSEALKQQIDDPTLLRVVPTVAVLLSGIVFLMTIKPDLISSLIVMVVALVLGLLTGFLLSRKRRAPQQEMGDQKMQDKASAG